MYVCGGENLIFCKECVSAFKNSVLLSFEVFQPLFRTFTLRIVNCGSQNISISSVHRKRLRSKYTEHRQHFNIVLLSVLLKPKQFKIEKKSPTKGINLSLLNSSLFYVETGNMCSWAGKQRGIFGWCLLRSAVACSVRQVPHCHISVIFILPSNIRLFPGTF